MWFPLNSDTEVRRKTEECVGWKTHHNCDTALQDLNYIRHDLDLVDSDNPTGRGISGCQQTRLSRVHYSVHNNPALVPIVRQLNPFTKPFFIFLRLISIFLFRLGIDLLDGFLASCFPIKFWSRLA
jgi:hypothetical protein